MDNIDQSNKKHLVPKSGRKVRENIKVKFDEKDKGAHHDSRGNTVFKRKHNVDRINKKAFSIQNVQKAKKKVAIVVDRRTTKHTFQTVNEMSLYAPHFVALIGPAGSGKSTLMRTFMRHYTGQRKNIEGPVTVVCSKKKRVTLFECPSDLANRIDIAKVADTILLLINVKQGLENETMDIIEALNAHGIVRVIIVYTHIDEYPKHDKTALQRMKIITKRLQTELMAKTFNLTECKKMRKDCNSEYKLEHVVNLARLIGQKNPLPNSWRENHPYVVADRIEKIESKSTTETDCFDFYGFLRGCKMADRNVIMHLMGVDDFPVSEVVVLSDPCPTPQQEATVTLKRHPLALKERRAYAPMCGYGGVLKDADGFHVEGKDDGSDDGNESTVIRKSCLIEENEEELNDEEDEEEEEEDEGPAAKKRMLSTELVEEFDELQSGMQINNNLINYERMVYDEDYECSRDKEEGDVQLSKDLFVSGKWDEDEDAAALLKKDDLQKKIYRNGGGSEYSDDLDDEEGALENEDDYEDESDMSCEDGERSDAEGEDDEESDVEGENDEGSDVEGEDDEGSDVEGEDDEGSHNDVDDEEYEEEDMDDEENEDGTKKDDEWISDTPNLTKFQKERLENASKSKRQKRLEKKEKKKALFDTEFDSKTGGEISTAYFDKWKTEHNEREQRNKEAFSHIDQENVHKFAGIEAGTYIRIRIANVTKGFFKTFSPKRPVILGCLAPGEECSAMLTGKFSLHRHFQQAKVIKHHDPLCFSIGWRRIQSFCHFYKEEDNLRKSYLKYSAEKGLFCNVAFEAPVVPVKTGFVTYLDLKPNTGFQVVALGTVLAKGSGVDIVKKVKRIGAPAQIFKKTAFIKNMFVDDLDVQRHYDVQIKTVSGIRGVIKKSVSEKKYPPGTFRATFEAPISLGDIVKVTLFATAPSAPYYQIIDNLAGEFEYWLPWNKYMALHNITKPALNPDSAYKEIVRPVFNPGPIEISKKVIEQLPFANRPPAPTHEDIVQESRPKIVLDAKESQRAQLLDNLKQIDDARNQKKMKMKEAYKKKKEKQNEKVFSKKELKEKETRKKFFKKIVKPVFGSKSGKKPKRSD